MPDFTIRALHRRDARAYRALRLDALEQYPASFATSVGEWSALLLRRIADMLTPTAGSAVFGAFREDGATGERLVGIAGLKRQDREKYRHKAMVWGTYVDPNWRGRGVARSLLESLIDHARAQPVLRRVVLTVTEGNAAAQALYERLGFRVYGVEPKAIDPGDGSYRDEILMGLDLQGACVPFRSHPRQVHHKPIEAETRKLVVTPDNSRFTDLRKPLMDGC